MASTSQANKQHLLLLPPAPSSPTFAAVKAAYHASLLSVLTDLFNATDRTPSSTDILDIALPCDHLYGPDTSPFKSIYFHHTQKLLATVYKLICIIATEANIPLDLPGGIDARVILLSYPRDGKLDIPNDSSSASAKEGPVVDIATLALSGRAWAHVYYVESESGQQIVRNFRSVSRMDGLAFKKTPGGIDQVVDQGLATEDATTEEETHTEKHHLAVVVGGTFDHLHIGHKLLLTMTAFLADPSETQRRLIIGVASDELLRHKKYIQFLQDWPERRKGCDSFLRSILHFSTDDSQIKTEEKEEKIVQVTMPSGTTIDYVDLMDLFGPTITDETLTALVISAETRAGGNAVNVARQEKAWPQVEVFVVEVIDADEVAAPESAELFQNKLSSTEIRRVLAEKSGA